MPCSAIEPASALTCSGSRSRTLSGTRMSTSATWRPVSWGGGHQALLWVLGPAPLAGRSPPPARRSRATLGGGSARRGGCRRAGVHRLGEGQDGAQRRRPRGRRTRRRRRAGRARTAAGRPRGARRSVRRAWRSRGPARSARRARPGRMCRSIIVRGSSGFGQERRAVPAAGMTFQIACLLEVIGRRLGYADRSLRSPESVGSVAAQVGIFRGLRGTRGAGRGLCSGRVCRRAAWFWRAPAL